MTTAIARRRETHFVLWRPAQTDPAPHIIIGRLQPGNPPTLIDARRIPLQASTTSTDLWEIPAHACQLVDGRVYHYWFEVTDSNPYKTEHPRVLCTDPLATTVDWRLRSPLLPAFGESDRDPAAVIAFTQGKLVACDPAGEIPIWTDDPGLATLPANNRLVIYELPTRWASFTENAGIQLVVGTFRDIHTLIESTAATGNVGGLSVGSSPYLAELGINALELLPVADSFVDREWGYATSNYFAADYDLGFPDGHASPTATIDLVRLITACHRAGIRFFSDVVMAFATQAAYQNINFADFHVQANAGDAEEFSAGKKRDGFGGDLFKYNLRVHGYDPISGAERELVPARQLMLAYLARWMLDFRIDGLRLDSVENIANWDFVGEFKNAARRLWHERSTAQGMQGQAADERFLVVGEELAVPIELLTQQRLDGLWNENFKRMLRYAVLGRNDEKEPSFEWTVRKLIDCRLLGFTDGTQAVNYVTSHDVEGFRNERLYNFLNNNGVIETEARIKLAFTCLLTAVGVPMIFAGEEFADEHDLIVRHPQKQVDPVNFDRAQDEWRQRVLTYVRRLIDLRTQTDALAVNDVKFIHVDFNDGKRVLVWQRGREGVDAPVVVVANFSDFVSAGSAGRAEYLVLNWPATPAGQHWREVTQHRDVASEWVGREPIFAWEAKVYVLVNR